VTWAVFAYPADGDLHEGVIQPGFFNADDAETAADCIQRTAERAGRRVECVVAPMVKPGLPAVRVAVAVGGS